MLHFPSLSFPASFHWLSLPAWDFSETLVSPTQFLKTLPTLNYLNITKFRGEFLPSKNSSCPCKHSYIFTASQSEIFSRSKVLLLIQSSLKYQKEYHWGTEEVRKHQTKVWIWNLGDYWINVVHSLPPGLSGWVGRDKTYWLNTISSGRMFPLLKKEVNKFGYNSSMRCKEISMQRQNKGPKEYM